LSILTFWHNDAVVFVLHSPQYYHSEPYEKMLLHDLSSKRPNILQVHVPRLVLDTGVMSLQLYYLKATLFNLLEEEKRDISTVRRP